FVNLVADDLKVSFLGECGNSGQLGPAKDRARRIPRRIEEHGPRARRANARQPLGGKEEASIMNFSPNRDWHASCESDRRLIGIIDGIGNENLITRIEDSGQGGTDSEG